mmetsp:Transcript_47420/g.152243  ORF Transcript_47420/g.152243 Transcript_47420/m.152243 type:complete len:1717 (-) Transcript_47420:120-5270(-)
MAQMVDTQRELQLSVARMKRQIELLDGENDYDDEPDDEVAEEDKKIEIRRSKKRALTKTDFDELGLTERLQKLKGLAAAAADEGAEYESESSSDSEKDFLNFQDHELLHNDETWNVKFGSKFIQRCFDTLHTKESLANATFIAAWFDRALEDVHALNAHLDRKEEDFNSEMRDLDQGLFDVNTSLEKRGARAIALMRQFHKQVLNLHEKYPLDSSSSGEYYEEEGELSEDEAMLRKDKEDKGTEWKRVRQSRKSQLALLGRGESDDREAEKEREGAGPGPEGHRPSGISRADTQLAGVIRAGAVIRQRKRKRKSLEEAAEEEDALRQLTLEEQAEAEEMKLRAAAKAKVAEKEAEEKKKKDLAVKNLGSNLLELISQQQEEITQLKTKNDMGSKRVEALKGVLEFTRALTILEEAGGMPGSSLHAISGPGGSKNGGGKTRRNSAPTLGDAPRELYDTMLKAARVDALAELMASEEGRAMLAKAAEKHRNPAMEAAMKSADNQHEALHMMAEIERLEKDLSARDGGANRIDELKEQLSKVREVAFDKKSAEKFASNAGVSKEDEDSVGHASEASSAVAPGAKAVLRRKNSQLHTEEAATQPASWRNKINPSVWVLQADDQVHESLELADTSVSTMVKALQGGLSKLTEALSSAKMLAVKSARLEKEEAFLDDQNDAAMGELKEDMKEVFEILEELKDEHDKLVVQEEELRAALKECRSATQKDNNKAASDAAKASVKKALPSDGRKSSARKTGKIGLLRKLTRELASPGTGRGSTPASDAKDAASDGGDGGDVAEGADGEEMLPAVREDQAQVDDCEAEVEEFLEKVRSLKKQMGIPEEDGRGDEDMDVFRTEGARSRTSNRSVSQASFRDSGLASLRGSSSASSAMGASMPMTPKFGIVMVSSVKVVNANTAPADGVFPTAVIIAVSEPPPPTNGGGAANAERPGQAAAASPGSPRKLGGPGAGAGSPNQLLGAVLAVHSPRQSPQLLSAGTAAGMKATGGAPGSSSGTTTATSAPGQPSAPGGRGAAAGSLAVKSPIQGTALGEELRDSLRRSRDSSAGLAWPGDGRGSSSSSSMALLRSGANSQQGQWPGQPQQFDVKPLPEGVKVFRASLKVPGVAGRPSSFSFGSRPGGPDGGGGDAGSGAAATASPGGGMLRGSFRQDSIGMASFGFPMGDAGAGSGGGSAPHAGIDLRGSMRHMNRIQARPPAPLGIALPPPPPPPPEPEPDPALEGKKAARAARAAKAAAAARAAAQAEADRGKPRLGVVFAFKPPPGRSTKAARDHDAAGDPFTLVGLNLAEGDGVVTLTTRKDLQQDVLDLLQLEEQTNQLTRQMQLFDEKIRAAKRADSPNKPRSLIVAPSGTRAESKGSDQGQNQWRRSNSLGEGEGGSGGEGGHKEATPHRSVTDDGIPEENKALRRQVRKRQMELDSLRKRWFAERGKTGYGADGMAHGQAEAALGMLLRGPPRVEAAGDDKGGSEHELEDFGRSPTTGAAVAAALPDQRRGGLTASEPPPAKASVDQFMQRQGVTSQPMATDRRSVSFAFKGGLALEGNSNALPPSISGTRQSITQASMGQTRSVQRALQARSLGTVQGHRGSLLAAHGALQALGEAHNTGNVGLSIGAAPQDAGPDPSKEEAPEPLPEASKRYSSRGGGDGEGERSSGQHGSASEGSMGKTRSRGSQDGNAPAPVTGATEVALTLLAQATLPAIVEDEEVL